MWGRWFGGGGAGSGGLYERGMAALRHGEYAAAISAFDALLTRADEADPLHQLAHFYRGEALGHLGRHALLVGEDAAAIGYLSAALAVAPSYPDLRLLRGIARLRSGDICGAGDDARDALQANPRFLEAHMLLAATHAELGEPQSATRAWEMARPLAAQRDQSLRDTLIGPVPSRLALIEQLLRESRRREAIQASRALLAQGFWEQARHDFAAYVEEQPSFPDLRFCLALAAYQLGAYESAREQLEKALSLQPQYAEAAVLLAVLELAQERIARAAELFALGAGARGGAGIAAYGHSVCAYLLGNCEAEFTAVSAQEFPAAHWLRFALAYERGDLRRARSELTALRVPDELDEVLDLASAALAVEDGDSLRRADAALPAGAPTPVVALLRARLASPKEGRPILRQALGAQSHSPAVARALAATEASSGELQAALDRIAPHAPARCAEAQAVDLAIWRVAERDDLLLAAPLAPGIDAWLERLRALRRSGAVDAARELLASLLVEAPLDLRLRLADPARWARPLLRWQAMGRSAEDTVLSARA